SASKHVCFILAGSSGNSLDDMVARIEKRPKGLDLLSRIPVENRVSIPSLTFGDRMIVALCQLLRAGSEKGIQVHEVERLALYYLTVNPHLSSARHLRDFALRCVQRIPPGRGSHQVRLSVQCWRRREQGVLEQDSEPSQTIGEFI